MPHIHEKVDFTVEVFVVFGDRVLLRKHDKYKVWMSVGGHIELDEDPNQAALREVKEEVGLDVVLDDSLLTFRGKNRGTELIPPYFMNRHRVNDVHTHVTLYYFAKATSDVINETIEREKSEECRWFSRKDLEEDTEVHERIKFYALTALEKLSV